MCLWPTQGLSVLWWTVENHWNVLMLLYVCSSSCARRRWYSVADRYNCRRKSTSAVLSNLSASSRDWYSSGYGLDGDIFPWKKQERNKRQNMKWITARRACRWLKWRFRNKKNELKRRQKSSSTSEQINSTISRVPRFTFRMIRDAFVIFACRNKQKLYT